MTRQSGERACHSHPAYIYVDGGMHTVTNRTLLWLFLCLKPPKRTASSSPKLTQDSRSRQGEEKCALPAFVIILSNCENNARGEATTYSAIRVHQIKRHRTS
jgi:hypothetical protein